MTDATLTINFYDAIGSAYDPRRSKFWVEFNTAEKWVIDSDGGVRMGAGEATVTDAGLVTIPGIPVPSGTSNPTDFQVRVHYDAPARVPSQRNKKRETGTFGWFTITADANLRDLVEQQYVPPTHLSEVTQQLDVYTETAAASATSAAASASAALQSAQDAKQIDGVGTVTPLAPGAAPTASITGENPSRVINLGIPAGAADDATMTQVADNPASAFRASLSASYASKSTQTAVETGRLSDATLTASIDAKATRRAGRPSPVAPIKSMVQACASGHGWTVVLDGSHDVNATDQVFLGTQSVKVTTRTDGTAARIEKTAAAVVDASDCDVRVWFRYDSAADLRYLSVMAGNSTFSQVSTAGSVINLDSTTDGVGYFSLPGGWIVLDIPQQRFGGSAVWSTIQRFRLDVQGKAGRAATVHFGGVALVKRDNLGRYPTGVVSLTFDDSVASAYTYARPKMDAYGYRGTLYPILDKIGTAGNLTLAQIKQMAAQGWEVGAHASTTAKHSQGMPAMTTAEREAECAALAAWQRDNGFPSRSFAWPIGWHSEAAAADVGKFFDSARLAFSTNLETTAPPMPFRLRSPNAGSQQASLAGLITAAAAGKSWLIVTLHDIVTSGGTSNDITQANFDTLLSNIAASGVAVRTVGEVLAGV